MEEPAATTGDDEIIFTIIREKDGKHFETSDSAMVLQWFLDLELDAEESSQYRAALLNLLEQDPVKLRRLLESAAVENDEVGHVLSLMVGHLAKFQNGCDYLVEWATENPKFYGSKAFEGSRIKIADKATPVDLIRLASISPSFEVFLPAALSRLSEKDPRAALRELQQFEGEDNYDALLDALKLALGRVAGRNPTGPALEMVAELAGEDEASRKMLQALAVERPKDAARIFGDLEMDPKSDNYRKLVAEISMLLSMKEHPHDALKWIGEKELDHRLQNVESTLVMSWFTEDATAAAAYINERTPSPQRDEIIRLIMTRIEANEALSWANKIQDHEMRARAIEKTLVKWYYEEPHEAREAIGKLNLSVDTRNRLTQMMHRAAEEPRRVPARSGSHLRSPR